jgi:hypothetical protein
MFGLFPNSTLKERVALGVAVFSGMLGVTIFGIFFTPVFYVVIRWFSGRNNRSESSKIYQVRPPAKHKHMADAQDGLGLAILAFNVLVLRQTRIDGSSDEFCESSNLVKLPIGPPVHRRCSFEKARMSIFGERCMSLVDND